MSARALDAQSVHFMPHIQGMRAVAVIAVLLFHVWPDLVRGGYVGVDVFFVISGFLITRLLLREREKTGTISLARFFARRVRRLLPAAMLTLVAVLIAAFVWFPESHWRGIVHEVIASTFYVENLYLVAKSVDYLAADTSPSPAQHFWSLSIEEQFYIVWPVLLLASWGLAERHGRDGRAVAIWVLGLLSLASLVYAVRISFVDPAVGYFVTTTRIWELGLGGLLALYGVGGAANGRWSGSLAMLGLSAILFSVFAYTTRLPFPGYEALVPTLGTVLLIVAAPSASSLVGKLLLTRPMQYLGDVSYSLYLWHWPVVVFYEPIFGHRISSFQDGLTAVALSLVLAHLSREYVEQKFRHGETGGGLVWRPFGVAVAGSLLVTGLGLGFVAIGDKRVARALDMSRAGIDVNHPGALGAFKTTSPNEVVDFVPDARYARSDRGSAYGIDGSERCIASIPATEPVFCYYGSESAAKRVVVVGDSHAVHWLPAFERVSESNNVRVIALTKSSCPFTAAEVEVNGRPFRECYEWGRKVMAWIVDYNPDLVVISQSSRHAMVGKGRSEAQSAIADGMVDYLSILTARGITVAAIRHTPWQESDVPTCILSAGSSVASCSGTSMEGLDVGSIGLAGQRYKSLKVMDFTEFFCRAGRCPVVLGGVLVYRDRHHMTATYAATLATPLLERMLATGALGSAQGIMSK